MTEPALNLFGQPLEPCREPGHTPGSWMRDGTCTERGGGVHQICARMNAKSDSFSALTGQRSGWSKDRNGQNHCLCLGAFAMHSAKTPVEESLDLKCSAIPSTALSSQYIQSWNTWNGLENQHGDEIQQIHHGVERLVHTCNEQLPPEDHAAREHFHGLVCQLHRDPRYPHLQLPQNVVCPTPPAPSQDLSAHYHEVFTTLHPYAKGNRNSASHLWSRFILDRAPAMEAQEVRDAFRQFCPVSGSTVRRDTLPSPYRLVPNGKLASGGECADAEERECVQVPHCCWPCVCDLLEGARVVPHTLTLKDGKSETFQFLTYAHNPCSGKKDGPLHPRAPGARCEDGVLKDAFLVGPHRDLPIIGMVHPYDSTVATQAVPPERCEERRKGKFKSGMGQIFRCISGVEPDQSPHCSPP